MNAEFNAAIFFLTEDIYITNNGNTCMRICVHKLVSRLYFMVDRFSLNEMQIPLKLPKNNCAENLGFIMWNVLSFTLAHMNSVFSYTPSLKTSLGLFNYIIKTI